METVEAIDGIQDVITYPQSREWQIMLATSAHLSDETQLYGVLARCGLDQFFSHIYCIKTTNLPMDEALQFHLTVHSILELREFFESLA